MTWNWKDNHHGMEKQAGIVAQETKEHIDFAVRGEEGHMKVDYNSLTGYLIAAVKDLSHMVEEQAELINELKM